MTINEAYSVWFFSVVAIFGGIITIVKFGRLIKGAYQRLIMWLTPQSSKKLDILVAGLAEVQAQLKTNGGSSLKDAINRIEDRSNMIEQLLMARLSVGNEGFLKISKDGDCEWANRKYCRMAGRSIDEMIGHGWINSIHTGDRVRVLANWNAALEDKREYDDMYRVADPDGNVTKVSAKTLKLIDTRKAHIGYLMTVVETDEV